MDPRTIRIWRNKHVNWDKMTAITPSISGIASCFPLQLEYMQFAAKAYRYRQCGNFMCNRRYLHDKYDMTLNKENEGMLVPMNSVKKNKGWCICKGCKTTRFCSRKCQKLAWNRYGHRKQCKQLQKILNSLSNN